MAFKFLRLVLTLLVASALLWIVLSSVFTNLNDPSFKLIESLHYKKVQLLIAHPDDEVMFFGPTINELLKPEYHNSIFVTCFSTGNDAGLGEVRAKELERSLQILGIKDFEIINDETKFQDSMSLKWSSSDILDHIQPDTDIILTFDANGVSSHPNHISLYDAALVSGKSLLLLKSWGVLKKYSTTLLTNRELLKKLVVFAFDHSKLKQVSTKVKSSQEIAIFADVSSFTLTLSSMINAHQSQMVWFRWGWVLISRYLNSNEVTYIASKE